MPMRDSTSSAFTPVVVRGYGKPVLIIQPSLKSVKCFKDRVCALTDRAMLSWEAESLVTHVNLYLRGWGYYFCIFRGKVTTDSD